MEKSIPEQADIKFYTLLLEFWTGIFLHDTDQSTDAMPTPHLPLLLRQSRDFILNQPTLPKETHMAISIDYERIRRLVFAYRHLTTREEKIAFQEIHTSETDYLQRMLQPTFKPS